MSFLKEKQPSQRAELKAYQVEGTTTPNSQSEGLQSLKYILYRWLPGDFHTCLYAMLTLTCMAEAICTGNIPGQLMILWSAAAASIGVPTVGQALNTIKGNLPQKATKRKPKQPMIE